MAGTSTVNRTVQHVLNRPDRESELAATADALHTAALLLAATHASFPPFAMLSTAIVLWSATAPIPALVAIREAAEYLARPPVLRRARAAAGRTSKAETSVVRA
jgi:hypothetical protein